MVSKSRRADRGMLALDAVVARARRVGDEVGALETFLDARHARARLRRRRRARGGDERRRTAAVSSWQAPLSPIYANGRPPAMRTAAIAAQRIVTPAGGAGGHNRGPRRNCAARTTHGSQTTPPPSAARRSCSSTPRACSPTTRSAIRTCARSRCGCRRATTKAPRAAARAGRGRRYPVLYDLVGFTGSGLAHLNWRPFDENVPERAARLIAERTMGPAIIVFPDCFTSTRRQPVRQLERDRPLRRLPDARDHPVRRPRVAHARLARPSRLLRQVVRRLRRDHPRHAVPASTGAPSPITRATR